MKNRDTTFKTLHSMNRIQEVHVTHPSIPTPLAIPFRLRISELSYCFSTGWGFIHPKNSICNGAFRVSNYSYAPI
jgi:hypothetical protein